MNRKLATITISALALAGVGGGAVAARAGGPAQPVAPGQAITIDVDARDTSGNALRGVDVSVLDVNGKIVDTDTTDSAGEADVEITTAGQYRIVASPPAGYTDRDDTDGNSASTSRVNCTDVLRCTHVDKGATAFSFPFAPNDTSAWFEFVPPAASVVDTGTVVDDAEDEAIEIGDDAHLEGSEGSEDDQPTVKAPKITPPPPTTAPPTTAPPTTVVDTAAADAAFALGYEDGYLAGFEGIDLYSPVPGYEDDYAEGYNIGSEVGSADHWALVEADDAAFDLGYTDGYHSAYDGIDHYLPVAGHEGAYAEGFAVGYDTAIAEMTAADEAAHGSTVDEAEAAFWYGYEDGYHEACDPGLSTYSPITGQEQAYAEGYDSGMAQGLVDCAMG